jgi:hypothetical protein
VTAEAAGSCLVYISFPTDILSSKRVSILVASYVRVWIIGTAGPICCSYRCCVLNRESDMAKGLPRHAYSPPKL